MNKTNRKLESNLVFFIAVFVVLFFVSNAFCETVGNSVCKQLYGELKSIREEIRSFMGDKTSFDTEKDKPLFDAYLKYDEIYKGLYAQKCLPLPVIKSVKNINESASLQLFFINSVQFFPWVLEYTEKGVPSYELQVEEKKIPETSKVCLFKFEAIDDFYGLVISCPFVKLEKQWKLTKYQITKKGNTITDGKVFTQEEIGKPYVIGIARVWFDLSSIKLEPEVKAWFEKEFRTLRGIIK